MDRRAILLLGWWLVSSIVSTASGREWRDDSGQYSRQAEFVALREGKVYLQLADGRSASVALDRLSEPDRAFVAQATEPTAIDPFVTVAATETRVIPAVMTTESAGTSETLPPQQTATLVALQNDPALAVDEATDVAKVRKYVYYGCYSTTHLIDLGPKSGVGTIHYCLRRYDGYCGSECVWYLAYLRKYGQDANFFYYTPSFSIPFIDMWAFARHPDCCGCKYSIWYRVAKTQKWRRFDCASRVRPK